jgi:hypothetical protein
MGACLRAEVKRVDVTLTLEGNVADGFLRIAYRLSNHGKLSLLAYDGTPGIPPEAEWPSLDGQIYISQQSELVALKRVYPTPPPNMDVNVVRMPPLSQVQPGQSRQVKFSLRLPLVERSEYTPDFPGAQYRERSVASVQLQIGYFWQMESMQVVPFPANPKAFRLKGAHGAEQFATASLAIRLPVRARVDDKFFRM